MPSQSLPKVGTKVRSKGDLTADFPSAPAGWPYKDPYDFMDGKRRDDSVPSRLHRVHDKLYDLKDFRHPGGELWLRLTIGTDITELFESHHINYNKATKMLQMYEVKAAEVLPPRRSMFTFDKDGFYATLRDRVWREHGELARLGPSALAVTAADAMALLSFALVAAAGHYASINIGQSAVLAVAAGLVNGTFIGIGHNFMHQQTNFRRYYLDLSGLSSAEFRMHHALSHHPFTNTILDAEINSLLPFVNFFPHQKTLGDKAAAGIVLALVCFLGIPLRQLKRFGGILRRTWPADRVDYLAQLIPVAQFVLFCNGTVHQLLQGGALWLLMLTSCSAVFLWGNFLEGPHFNDECWHQGDTLDSTDWGILQIQTSVE